MLTLVFTNADTSYKVRREKEKKGPTEKEKFAHIQIAGTSTSSKDQLLNNAEYF